MVMLIVTSFAPPAAVGAGKAILPGGGVMAGFPLGSFIFLIVCPGIIVSLMVYGCLRIRKRDED
jgi:hypothetical protein